MNHDDMVMQLISITDADYDDAKQSLEANNWRLDFVTEQFFSTGSLPMPPKSNSQQQRQPSFERHAAQQHRANSVHDPIDVDDEDQIRAPIMPRRETLNEQTPAAMFHAQQPMRARVVNTNAFDQSADNRDFRAEGVYSGGNRKRELRLFRTVYAAFFVGFPRRLTAAFCVRHEFPGDSNSKLLSAAAVSNRAAKLAAIFEPPRNIMFMGSYEEVRSSDAATYFS